MKGSRETEGGERTGRAALRAVLLHGDMGIEVIECAICLGTVWPTALVEAFNFVVAATRTLLDRVAGQGNEGVCFPVGGITGDVAEGALELLGGMGRPIGYACTKRC